MLQIGEILDRRYEILKEIGSGGTGVLFLAYYHGLRKYVVVKRIKEGFTGDLNQRVEADTLKNLHHPYLPQVYDFLALDMQVYTVMDYIKGRDLEYYLQTRYRFGEKQLVRWLDQLLDVLSYLHGQKPPIIHSDIKPANIMINENGDICLIDFNISLGSEESRILGMTRQYASPEQVRQYEELTGLSGGGHERIDARSDLYSLGLSFYALMTGVVPSIDRDLIVPLSQCSCGYSSAFKEVVERAMQQNRNRRFRSADQMRHALGQMKRYPSRWLRAVDGIATAVWFLGLTAAVWMYAFGVGEAHRRDYLGACQELHTVYADYDGGRVRELGGQILEEDDWSGYLEKDADVHADILHAIGDSWFWEEDYAKASSYYDQALTLKPTGKMEKICCRDAAIAAARSGDAKKAGRILDEAVKMGFSDAELLFVQGEIALSNGVPEDAKSAFERALGMTSDAELLVRALQGMGKSCALAGDYAGQLEAFQKMTELRKNIVNLRKLGMAYSQYAASMGDAKGAQKFNEAAKACYEEILGMEFSTKEDLKNYAVICENCGEYSESLSVLKELAKSYPDDYELSKRICYLLYRMGDYEQMRDYYGLAWRQYEIQRVSGEMDDEMMALKQVMDSLEGSEW